MLEQFEQSPDILATFHSKNVDKTFFFFCNPNDKEKAQSAHIQQQCLELCLLSTRNQCFLIRIVYTTNYR